MKSPSSTCLRRRYLDDASALGEHRMIPFLADRDRLQKQLQTDGLSTGLHDPINVHLQQAHGNLGHKTGDFPLSEAAANEVSLPMFPEMTSSQVEQVVATVEHRAHAR